MDLNKGVPMLFTYSGKLIWKFFSKFNLGTCPWVAFAWIFLGDFKKNFDGGLWGKLFIWNMYYFGTQIFHVVWPVQSPLSGHYIQCVLLNAEYTI